MLHLRCGSDILEALGAAGLPGRAAEWADPLCEGPLAPWSDEASRRETRARWLASRGGRPEAAIAAQLSDADEALASAADEDEVVLWFEHDLYDQAILVYLLTRLEALAPDRTTLICIGSHPEVPEFSGLGHLSPAQLGALFPGRQPVGAGQFAQARRAWAALCGPDPRAIEAVIHDGTPDLPFLAAALRRFLAEYPSVRNGLGETEMMALQAVAAGAELPAHAFQAVQRFEDAPWLGDLMFYARLRTLTQGPAPLLEPSGEQVPEAADPRFRTMKFELSLDGALVSQSRADWFQLARPALWYGGVLLEGPDPAWRWDDRQKKLVAAG